MAQRGSGCLKVVLGLIIVPMIAGLGFWFLSNLNRVLTHESVEATVVDLIASTDSDGDTVYAPVYEYAVDGQTYRYTSQVSLGGLVVPDIGDRRTLLYNADNPGDARVRNMFLLLVLPVILMLIPLSILAVVGVAAARRRSRSSGWNAAESEPPWSVPQYTDSDREVIDAVFMGAEPSQMDAAGKVRYRVTAQAEIDGTLHRFRGEWLEEDPTLLFMERGNRVQVHIDPTDPSSYELVMPVED